MGIKKNLENKEKDKWEKWDEKKKDEEECENNSKKDTSDFPTEISKKHYYYVKNNKDEFEKWYYGLVGFCSFGGKYWGICKFM